jgi:predicted GNAT family acetyltransferase
VRVVRHAGPRPFLDRAGTWLEEAEAERALLLGISADLVAAPGGGAAPYLATVEHQDGVVTAALRTPPHTLVVSRAPDGALDALAADLHVRGEPLPGVEGPSRDAEVFAACWRARTGVAVRPGMSQRIYECREVTSGAVVPGSLLPAREDDVALLVGWRDGFHRDTGIAGLPGDEPERTVRGMIAKGRLFLWDDGGPRSMAAWTGPTPSGVRGSYVYTPPERRGAGYARSTVAALTDHLLRSGRRFCALYTDAANPTSNRLYQRIGYLPVCEWTQRLFGQGGGAARTA